MTPSVASTCQLDVGRPRDPDSYLLARAVADAGQLATFDHRWVANAVHGGAGALRPIA